MGFAYRGILPQDIAIMRIDKWCKTDKTPATVHGINLAMPNMYNSANNQTVRSLTGGDFTRLVIGIGSTPHKKPTTKPI